MKNILILLFSLGALAVQAQRPPKSTTPIISFTSSNFSIRGEGSVVFKNTSMASVTVQSIALQPSTVKTIDNMATPFVLKPGEQKAVRIKWGSDGESTGSFTVRCGDMDYSVRISR